MHNAGSTIQNCLLMLIVAAGWFTDKIDSVTALGVLLCVAGLIAVPAAFKSKLPPETPIALGGIGVFTMLTKFLPHAAMFLALSLCSLACSRDAGPAVSHTILAAEQLMAALCPADRAATPECVEAARALRVAKAGLPVDAGEPDAE